MFQINNSTIYLHLNRLKTADFGYDISGSSSDFDVTGITFDENGFSHFNFTSPGGRVFGRYSPGTVARYYLTDHLGSTRLVTDQNNAILATFDYYPFGLLMPGRYTTNNNTIEKFTGKELDSRLNLYYFGARYLDPAIGRWLSVDPLLQKHPEWSPYNYALDNPLYYVDPDGRQIEFFRGAWKGFSNSVVDAAKGTWHMISHPADAARSMSYAATHPTKVYNMVKAGAAKRWDMVASGDPSQIGQVVGEAAGTALMALAGAKGAAKLTKGVGKVTKVFKASISFNKSILDNFAEHIFSQKHIKGGIMDLGSSSDDILKSVGNTIEGNLSSLKEGSNTIITNMNGNAASIIVNVKNGTVRSVNAFKGVSKRKPDNLIDLRND